MRKIKISQEHFMEIYKLLDREEKDIHDYAMEGGMEDDDGWGLSTDEDVRDQIHTLMDNKIEANRVTKFLSRIFCI